MKSTPVIRQESRQSTFKIQTDGIVLKEEPIYRNYSPVQEPIDHKREMVLFFPFRNEEMEILGDNKFLEIFQNNINYNITNK